MSTSPKVVFPIVVQATMKATFLILALFAVTAAADVAMAAPLDDTVGPFVARYCGKCHGEGKAEADLHLGKLLKSARLDDAHEEWLKVVRALERREMPPAEEPQPAEQERTAVAKAIRDALKAFYARTAAGDPGEIVLRRLTNAEYDYAVEDLTGVKIAPSWRFPRNETSGEGFDNVASALGVRSSALIEKYLEAAEDVAGHAFMLPSRGLVFSRLTSEQSSRPQRAHEACVELKAFYDTIAAEIPKRADLARAIVAAWQFRHREQFAGADLAEFARQQQVDPRYADWLWRQLHDKQAGAFQRQLLQEPFAALPAPSTGGNTTDKAAESVRDAAARCQRIADGVTLALHATIGQSLKELPNPTPFYMPGRHELAQPRKIERTLSTGDSSGLILYLVASDAGVPVRADDPIKPFVIWEQIELRSKSTAVRVGELLESQKHPLVLHDRLPDGHELREGEFAVPVPSLIEIKLPPEVAPAKSDAPCQAKFRLAGPPSSVAMIGVITDRELDFQSPRQDGNLPPGRIVAGAELRTAGDSESFRQAWSAYDDFFQRFGLPHFPTEVDLDTAPRNG
ncbi:MAG: DUF1587 domain-containing protein, partial [Planctomycetota bacterium]|nr:DUF1587 domain-containing protein [Planctomycetota bacterium]